KLAFWMATGSGKTLLMHLNYRQFLHYEGEPPDNVLLITPNAGLTAQHLEEMRMSGIPCERFSAAESGLGLAEENVVRVLEITKLTGNKKGGGESVDVGAFEGRSLIFVDEGHKGAGGGKDTWPSSGSTWNAKTSTPAATRRYLSPSAAKAHL
ncbi:MAG: DEAD/DEAH box helicase family protein, partial [Actinomycetota bacterium]|nr:DEAD/DEAH box helicase family protein [Actinomycetota bacterium]